MESSPLGITTVNTTHHHHGSHRPHISYLPNEEISFLTPYCGLIITLWMVLLFLIRFYLLEEWIFPRYYGKTYLDMDEGGKRGFLNHHIAGGTKVFLLGLGIYPWVSVLFGHATLHSSFGRTNATMGDILIMITELFVAMYVFELFYRKKLSYVAVAHHVGAVVIAQSGVVLSLDLSHQKDATLEYVMCLVWGAFDVLSELWLNLAFILYRVYPDNHYFLQYMFLGTFLISITGTIAETIVVFTLFGGSWSQWEISFKVVTPVLHTLFTVAQIHAAKILYLMFLKQRRIVRGQANELHDVEGQKSAKGKKDAIVREEEVRATEASFGDEITPAPTGSAPLDNSNEKRAKPAFLQRIPFLRKMTGQ